MADPLYDVDNLTSEQISSLASKARSRNAGEGMNDYQTALDQVRFEEGQLFNTDQNYSGSKLFRDIGEVYTNFTRQDGSIAKTPEARLAYLDKVGGRDKFGTYYDKIVQDIQSGNLGLGENYSNLYNTRGTIAGANAVEQYFSGTQQPEDFSQVVSTYAPEAITGQVQSETNAQSQALGTNSKIVHVGADYNKNGVDIKAPAGTFAVQYENGAVEFRKLPSTGRIPSASEITPSNREGADVGAVGKEVARTGTTAFNPNTGADFEVQPDEYVIEYTDGTFEVRKRPQGGYVPSADQLRQGGDSSAAKPLTEGGKTLGELKKEQGLAPSVADLVKSGASAQEIDQAIEQAGLKPTSELELLGKTVNGKTASEGNLFYQDPETREILERPESLQALAKSSTSIGRNIEQMFAAVFGRQPSPEELSYWKGRTDKSGAALIGAMQFAKLNGRSQGEQGATSDDPISVIKNTANNAQQKLVESYASSGITPYSDEKKALRAEIDALKQPETKSLETFTKEQLASSQFQEAVNDLNTAKDSLRQLDADYLSNIEASERTKGLSMGAIRRNQGELDVAYNRARRDLVAEVEAYSDIVQSQSTIMGLMIDAFKYDQSAAQQDYANRLNKATALYNIVAGEESFAFEVGKYAEEKQRANLAVITGLVGEGKINYDTLPSDAKAQIDRMEQATGLVGVTQALSKTGVPPVVSIGSQITAADGSVYFPIMSQDPITGEVSISQYNTGIKERVPGSGSGSGDLSAILSAVLGAGQATGSDWAIDTSENSGKLEEPPMSAVPGTKFFYKGYTWVANSKREWE